MSPFDLATVEAAFFEPLIGATFIARSADGAAHELTLIAAQKYPHGRAAEGMRTPFSLLFKPAPGQAPLAQGTYECEARGIERTEIFLVPVQDAVRGVCIEAVFN